MRFKGKKPIFTRKDTWHLPTVLNPVIAAGLKKFLEMKHGDKGEWFGVPVGMLLLHNIITSEQAEDVSGCDVIWEDVLNKMIYAFDVPEPCISQYKFDYDWIPLPDSTDEHGNAFTMKLQEGTESEKERYDQDLEEHNTKVKEGRDLFIKFYDSLWW